MIDITWKRTPGFEDIRYEKSADGIAKITINRPEVRNAFRPQTVERDDRARSPTRATTRRSASSSSPARATDAFCSGGDQRVRGDGGYVGDDGIPRLNVLDLQKQIRYAAQAGHRDGRRLRDRRRPRAAPRLRPDHRRRQRALRPDRAQASAASTPASARRYLARIVGQKKAREIWFLCRQYDAQAGARHGPRQHRRAARRSSRTRRSQWCREILAHSPTALRFLKAAINADCDGQAGLQEFAGNATLLYYMTEEGKEGKNAFLEKRKPDFKKFRRLP